MNAASTLFANASVTLAIAVAAGLIAQIAATHLHIPGLVLLLATGVVLGPDVANVVRPNLLGATLHAIVGFAVAVILFEGGLALDMRRLRRERRAIQQLVSIGALITAIGGTLTARLALGWSWRISALFGTLIIVTGPTVVTPLLRRIKVESSTSTVLEAEGVLIDAIGAIVAAVALQVALWPTGEQLVVGMVDVALRISLGTAIGVAGGLLIGLPMRRRHLVPQGLENVFTLAMVIAIFQISNGLLRESGIAAVIAAGIVVRNSGTHVERELREFKEQLSAMLIGLLFVLLAADVRIEEVTRLGHRAIFVVLALIFIVRPLDVLGGTWGTSLDWRQRLFVAWIGPRGIVAAAVASLFVSELGHAGIEAGKPLRAMVFLVIAATVVWSGLTGGLVASLLGLRRRRDAGWVILGAGPLARTVASLVSLGSEEVVCIDSNPHSVERAEGDDLRVIYGNALEPRVLRMAEVDTRAGVVGMTPNETTNLLFLERVRLVTKEVRMFAVLASWDDGVTPHMVEDIGAEVLFGGAEDIRRWDTRIEREEATIGWWRLVNGARDSLFTGAEGNPPYVPLVVKRGDRVSPLGSATDIANGDEVACLTLVGREGDAAARLGAAGYAPVDGDERSAPGT